MSVAHSSIQTPAPSSQLRLRPFRREDAAEAVELLPDWLGLEAAQQPALIALWQSLADQPALISAVQEDLSLPEGQRLQGWGATLAMPPDWMAACMPEGQADPRRCSRLSRDVYAGLLSGALKLPGERDMGRANAGEGLVLLALHYCQRRWELDQPYALRVLSLANEGLRAAHAGYQIQAFYMQAQLSDEPWLQAAGFRRRHDPIEPSDPAGTLLYGLTWQEAARMLPGQSARVLFEHQPPRFRLSASQRRLLWLSLYDEQDELLMQQLGVSAHGLKKLWRGIYERIADVEPDFFGLDGDDSDGKRGPEKRRRVLAYVRQRPEELRPWA